MPRWYLVTPTKSIIPEGSRPAFNHDQGWVYAEKMSVIPDLYQRSPSTRWSEPCVSSDRIESEWRFFAKLYNSKLVRDRFWEARILERFHVIKEKWDFFSMYFDQIWSLVERCREWDSTSSRGSVKIHCWSYLKVLIPFVSGGHKSHEVLQLHLVTYWVSLFLLLIFSSFFDADG